MDQVLEQVISAIEPMDLAKTAECYQRLASLTIRQTASCPIWQAALPVYRGRCIRKNCRKPSSSLQLTMPSMAEKIRPRARTARPTPRKSPLAEGLSIRWPTASVPASCSLDMGPEEDIPESQGVQNLKVMHGSHFWARRGCHERR